MTQNPGQTAGSPPQQLSGLDRFFGWLRSLDVRRATDDKWLAGVCSGIARRLGVDPLVVRAGLIVLILLGGLGVTLYLVAWALLPTEDGSIVAERGLREGDAGGILLLVLIALSVVGGSGLFDGQGWGLWWQWWLIVPIGLLTVWLVTRGRSSSSTGGAAYEPPPASAAAHPGWAPAALPPGAVAATASTAPAGPATTSGPTVPGTVGPMAPGAMGPGAMGPGGPLGPTGPGGPPRPPVGYLPPQPPAPPRPRHRGAGFLAAVVMGGLALATYGLTVWAHAEYDWSGDQHVVGLAAALAVLATGVVAMGLAGFRSGLTGFVAVLLAVTTWLGSVLPQVDVSGGIGDRVWRPDGTPTSETYRLGIGSADLLLGDYPTDPSTPGEIDVRVGVGDLRIGIPDDLTVEVRSEVSAGDITQEGGWSLNENNRWTQDGGGGRNLSSTEVIGTGPVDVVVKASVGLGQITIGKE